MLSSITAHNIGVITSAYPVLKTAPWQLAIFVANFFILRKMAQSLLLVMDNFGRLMHNSINGNIVQVI